MNPPNNVAGLLIYKFNKSVKAKLAVRSLVQLWRHPTQQSGCEYITPGKVQTEWV